MPRKVAMCGRLAHVNDEGAMGINKGRESLQPEIDRLTAEVARLQLQWTGMKDEVNLCHASIARLRAALEGLDHLSLVIETAVRNCDPTQHNRILAALKIARKALANEQ